MTVSVVMSVYNDAEYLERSIASILSQEGVPFEFVIVDDGSTDNSPAMLSRYAEHDSRIRLIKQQNTGLTKALINGCKIARGRYIARQDADDISCPGRLARQAQRLDADKSLAFVSSLCRIIGPNDEVLNDVVRSADPDEASRQLMEEQKGPPHGSVMFRKSAYDQAKGYREQFYYAQDRDLWLRLVQHGKLAFEQAFLYHYRCRVDSISSDEVDFQSQFGDIGALCLAARLKGESEAPYLAKAAEIKDAVVAGGQNRPGHRRRLAMMYYFIGANLRCRDDQRATKYFLKAIKMNPCHFRAWARLVASLVKFRRERAAPPPQ